MGGAFQHVRGLRGLVSGEDRPRAGSDLLAPSTLGLRVAPDDQNGASRVMQDVAGDTTEKQAGDTRSAV